MKLVIAAGGTGGHLFPGIAVAQVLREIDPQGEITFTGSERMIEEEILKREGFSKTVFPVGRLKGESWFARLKTLFALPQSLLRARRFLKKFRPDVVLGTGGYSSGPVVLAALFSHIPRAILEPNAIPGFTNRILALLVNRIFVAFAETSRFFPQRKIRVTGTPVRRELTKIGQERNSQQKMGPFTLLILGGSQGSSALNEAITSLLPSFRSLPFHIIHQTGLRDYESVRSAYLQAGVSHEVSPFLQDMADAYRRADLVISRAGASTVAELIETGTPSILVPYPFAADDHQRRNALSLVEAGGAEMVPEKGETALSERLAKRIFYYERNREELEKMSEKIAAMRGVPAAEAIARECLQLCHVSQS